MTYPITPDELTEIEERLREELLSDLELLEQVVPPDSDLGRRFYPWLEATGLNSDINFIWNFEQLKKEAYAAWQDKSN